MNSESAVCTSHVQMLNPTAMTANSGHTTSASRRRADVTVCLSLCYLLCVLVVYVCRDRRHCRVNAAWLEFASAEESHMHSDDCPPSLLFPSANSTHAPPQGGLHFLEGKLIGVSTMPTSMSVLGSQPVRADCAAKRPKSSLDTNLDDFATTVDASEFVNTTEVGQLTSPLFSQERDVSANPFRVSGSQEH